MKLSQFTTHLRQHPEHPLNFFLHVGDRVPGRIDTSLVGCCTPGCCCC